MRLTRRIEGETEAELPLDTTWVQRADSTGLAVFKVPPGVYAIGSTSQGSEETRGCYGYVGRAATRSTHT